MYITLLLYLYIPVLLHFCLLQHSRSGRLLLCKDKVVVAGRAEPGREAQEHEPVEPLQAPLPPPQSGMGCLAVRACA